MVMADPETLLGRFASVLVRLCLAGKRERSANLYAPHPYPTSLHPRNPIGVTWRHGREEFWQDHHLLTRARGGQTKIF